MGTPARLNKTSAQIAIIPTAPGPLLRGDGDLMELHVRMAAAQQVESVQGYDTVAAWNLIPSDGVFFVCYGDGAWPNESQARAYFPKLALLVLTTGFGAFQGIDYEPGNGSWGDWAGVANWMKGRIAAGVKPVLYISASLTEMAIGELATNGIDRSQYFIDSAHWTGVRHLCAPAVCGYPDSDLTQYSGNIGGALGYDADVALATVFAPTPTPTPAPTPAPQPTPTPAPVAAKEEDMQMLACVKGQETTWLISGAEKVKVASLADESVLAAQLKAAGWDPEVKVLSQTQLEQFTTAAPSVSPPA